MFLVWYMQHVSRSGKDDSALTCGVYNVNFAKCSWFDTCKTCCGLGKTIVPWFVAFTMWTLQNAHVVLDSRRPKPCFWLWRNLRSNGFGVSMHVQTFEFMQKSSAIHWSEMLWWLFVCDDVRRSIGECYPPTMLMGFHPIGVFDVWTTLLEPSIMVKALVSPIVSDFHMISMVYRDVPRRMVSSLDAAAASAELTRQLGGLQDRWVTWWPLAVQEAQEMGRPGLVEMIQELPNRAIWCWLWAIEIGNNSDCNLVLGFPTFYFKGHNDRGPKQKKTVFLPICCFVFGVPEASLQVSCLTEEIQKLMDSNQQLKSDISNEMKPVLLAIRDHASFRHGNVFRLPIKKNNYIVVQVQACHQSRHILWQSVQNWFPHKSKSSIDAWLLPRFSELRRIQDALTPVSIYVF